jgi:O-antigen/teichoic acid export membrane protein
MALLSILAAKFVAVGLSKELAGYYNSAYGYLQLFGILADFGLYMVAVREVSRAREKGDVLGAVVLLRIIILILSLGSALLLAWLIPMWRGTPLPLGITIASLVPFFTLLAGVLRTVFQVTYKMHYVFIAEVTQRVLTTSLIGFFILMGVRGSHDLEVYHLFLFAGGIGAFVLFALSAIYARTLMPVYFPIRTDLLKRLTLLALPYGLAYLCTALYRQFDTTIIALLRPDFEIQNAYYGFVVRMTDMAYLIPTFLLNSTLPVMAERSDRGGDLRRLLGKTLLTLLTLGSIALLFALLWPRPLVELLTTNAYLSTPTTPGSDTALVLLALPMFLNGLIQYCFYVLLTQNEWRTLVRSLAIGGALSVFLNLWLVPLLGFRGNAITSIVIHLLLTFTLLPKTLRTAPIKLPANALARWFAFTLLLGVSLLLIAPLLTHSLRTMAALGISTVWIVILAEITGLRRAVAQS